MGKHDGFTKSLAIIGTILVTLPILLPLVLGLRFIGSPVGYRVDYLMPFEVYPITLIGTILLVWASFRARVHKRAILIAIAVMIGGVVLAGVSAQVTGIAKSVEQLEAWRYTLTAALGGLSIAGQIALIVIGGMLIRDLFSARGDAAPPADGVRP